MTRGEDVRAATELGAAYVGVILADGPRKLTLDRAAEVLGEVRGRSRRVGVFGQASPREVADAARALKLDAVQLHGASDGEMIGDLRTLFDGDIWAVLRIAGGTLPPESARLFWIADAVVLDAFVHGKLGGTGVPLPWEAVAAALPSVRGSATLVLAGGLRAENVREATRLLRPGIVDVSSGVETAPGIKDHARMRAFRDAVRDSE
jgi:phosphoribosylanthranilate isomerase